MIRDPATDVTVIGTATAESVGAAVVLAAAGALALGLGYLVRYRDRYQLIAGFDPDAVDDPAALARDVGGLGLVVGGLLLGAAMVAVLVQPGEPFWTAFALVLTALCVAVPVGIHLRHD